MYFTRSIPPPTDQITNVEANVAQLVRSHTRVAGKVKDLQGGMDNLTSAFKLHVESGGNAAPSRVIPLTEAEEAMEGRIRSQLPFDSEDVIRVFFLEDHQLVNRSHVLRSIMSSFLRRVSTQQAFVRTLMNNLLSTEYVKYHKLGLKRYVGCKIKII